MKNENSSKTFKEFWDKLDLEKMHQWIDKGKLIVCKKCGVINIRSGF